MRLVAALSLCLILGSGRVGSVALCASSGSVHVVDKWQMSLCGCGFILRVGGSGVWPKGYPWRYCVYLSYLSSLTVLFL